MVNPHAPATRLTHALRAGHLDPSAPVAVLTATACRVHVPASPAPGAPVPRRHQLTEGGRELVGRLTPLLMIVLDHVEFRDQGSRRPSHGRVFVRRPPRLPASGCPVAARHFPAWSGAVTMAHDVTGARRSVLAEFTAEGGNPMRALPPAPDLPVQVRGPLTCHPGARRPAGEGPSTCVRRDEVLGLLGSGGTTSVGVGTTRVLRTAGEVTTSRSRWPWCR
ncbi:hypothetical protein [Actinoalloteichus caeruleus]|uniref:hypothetical protein n=1 Tax=Actinoalloteichus cyanogriseus TaxID=2893586 RepID=UPI0004BE66F5|nr:hypothetical protein [Actinoalloteichus caeruleus]